MAKKAVKYAKLRGTTYHFNIPIPPSIRNLHPTHPTGIFRGTMKTSDPDEADRQVRKQKAIFDEQEKQAARRKDRDRIASLLDPSDLNLIEEIGGIQNVVPTIIELRKQAAFTLAGRGADFPDDDEVEGGSQFGVISENTAT